MPNPSRRLLEFEGLRGIAAVVVVFHHLVQIFSIHPYEALENYFQWIPTFLRPIVCALAAVTFDGYIAIAVFWVMSAFVLSLRTFRKEAQSNSSRPGEHLSEAALRRYPRLMIPATASVIFAYVLHQLGWMHNDDLAQYFGPPYSNGALASFYQFDADFTDAVGGAVWATFFSFDITSSYNTVLWTMEKELYGSFFLFGFLAVYAGIRWRPLGYIAAVYVLRRLGIHWLNAFVLGIALCDAYCNRSWVLGCFPYSWRSMVGRLQTSRAVSLGVTVVILIAIGRLKPGVSANISLAVLLSFWVLFSAPLRAALSRPIPVFLGKISFGLYLCHWPILCSFGCWSYLACVRQSIPHSSAILISSFFSVILSLLGGFILYRVADKPSLGISKALSSAIIAATTKAASVIGQRDTPPNLSPDSSMHPGSKLKETE